MSTEKDKTTGDQPAFEARENMLPEDETERLARERIGDKPQVERADQKGKPGSEQGDEFIDAQKKSDYYGGYADNPRADEPKKD